MAKRHTIEVVDIKFWDIIYVNERLVLAVMVFEWYFCKLLSVFQNIQKFGTRFVAVNLKDSAQNQYESKSKSKFQVLLTSHWWQGRENSKRQFGISS